MQKQLVAKGFTKGKQGVLSKYDPVTKQYEECQGLRTGCIEAKLEMNDVSNLVGKLLTIADASFTDKQQREGVKSLIKQIVWAWGKEWHVVATEQAVKDMEEHSELIHDTSTEEQIEHFVE